MCLSGLIAMTNVFISYRRNDTHSNTSRICEKLVDHFGEQNVFMDTGGIPYGMNFEEHIQARLEACDVLVAIIGPDWATAADDGRERIHEKDDWVRREIRFALERGTRIIPVLIDRTECLRADRLPTDLKGLEKLMALRLDTGIDFKTHIDRLIEAISGKKLTILSSGPRLALRLAQPAEGTAALPKPISDTKELFLRNELMPRIDREFERMGLPSRDWVGSIITSLDTGKAVKEFSAEERYALKLADWYDSFVVLELGNYARQLEAVRTVQLKLMLANEGTFGADEIEVELEIAPHQSIKLSRPGFGSYRPSMAPTPPIEMEGVSPKDLRRPEIDWYDRPSYLEEPLTFDGVGRVRLNEGKIRNNRKILVGSTKHLYHDHEISIDPIYIVYGEQPAADIEIDYKLFATNQPVSGQGRLSVKVSEQLD